MATIKATCPMCGDVDLTPRQVRVRVVEAIDETDSRRTYSFGCPACHERVEKAADAEVVRLLSSAGVRVERVPGARRRPARSTRRTPIGYDDLLDLVLWLECHDAVAAGAWRPPSAADGSVGVIVVVKSPGARPGAAASCEDARWVPCSRGRRSWS